jgi:hypothetical protein
VSVVSNSSALINLARIGELALLHGYAGFRVSDRLYTRVLQDEGEMASEQGALSPGRVRGIALRRRVWWE